MSIDEAVLSLKFVFLIGYSFVHFVNKESRDMALAPENIAPVICVRDLL